MLYTFKMNILQVKFNNLLKVCLFLLLHKKICELQKKCFTEKIKKDQKVGSQIHSECFLDELFSQPESKLHRATSPLLKPALLCH